MANIETIDQAADTFEKCNTCSHFCNETRVRSDTTFRHPGLDPGSRCAFHHPMDREARGGWVYIMADRYRGTMYTGVTSDLPRRIHQHREGGGSEFCARYGLRRLVWAERGDTIEDCIAHEKRIKRWRRAWKFALIENDWEDLYDRLI